jgi:ERCC4-type nuclease
MTSKYHLVIDKRERDIINILNNDKQTYNDGKGKKISWKTEHITIGDYIIFHENKALIVIERKTWADLAASFRDGRKENINKLKQFNEQTGAKIAYLIEGIAFPSKSSKFARIPYNNLRAHLDHLLIRDNIIELRSGGHRGTVDRLFELIRNMSTLALDDFNIVREPTEQPIEQPTEQPIEQPTEQPIEQPTEQPIDQPISGGDLQLAKVQFTVNDGAVIDRLWCCVPGISINSVKLFRGHHIMDLLLGNLKQPEISALKYTNGRTIGNKKAKKIASISRLTDLSNNASYIRILSNLPGISRPTAEKILAVYPMKEILTNWNNIRTDLVKLSRGKNSLGETAVSTIEKYLVKPTN